MKRFSVFFSCSAYIITHSYNHLFVSHAPPFAVDDKRKPCPASRSMAANDDYMFQACYSAKWRHFSQLTVLQPPDKRLLGNSFVSFRITQVLQTCMQLHIQTERFVVREFVDTIIHQLFVYILLLQVRPSSPQLPLNQRTVTLFGHIFICHLRKGHSQVQMECNLVCHDICSSPHSYRSCGRCRWPSWHFVSRLFLAGLIGL